MSKIPKVQNKDLKSDTKRKSEDKFAYRTVVISTILSLIFYVVSLLFNTGIVSFFNGINLFFDILDIGLKVIAILLFFLFMMINSFSTTAMLWIGSIVATYVDGR